MTELLQKAFDAASQLPPQEQDAIADWLLRELQSEARWSRLLADSQDALTQLADETLAEHQAGTASDIGFINRTGAVR